MTADPASQIAIMSSTTEELAKNEFQQGAGEEQQTIWYGLASRRRNVLYNHTVLLRSKRNVPTLSMPSHARSTFTPKSFNFSKYFCTRLAT